MQRSVHQRERRGEKNLRLLRKDANRRQALPICGNPCSCSAVGLEKRMRVVVDGGVAEGDADEVRGAEDVHRGRCLRCIRGKERSKISIKTIEMIISRLAHNDGSRFRSWSFPNALSWALLMLTSNLHRQIHVLIESYSFVTLKPCQGPGMHAGRSGLN